MRAVPASGACVSSCSPPAVALPSKRRRDEGEDSRRDERSGRSRRLHDAHREDRPEDVAEPERHRVEAHDERLVRLVGAREQRRLGGHPDRDRERAVEKARDRERRGRRQEGEDRYAGRIAEEGDEQRLLRAEALHDPAGGDREGDDAERERSGEPAHRELGDPVLLEVDGEHGDRDAVGDPEQQDRRVDDPDVAIGNATEEQDRTGSIVSAERGEAGTASVPAGAGGAGRRRVDPVPSSSGRGRQRLVIVTRVDAFVGL